MLMVVLIILVLLTLGGLPQTGYHQWGYAPSGALGFIVIILVVLLLLGRL
jgi:hypothetical protein